MIEFSEGRALYGLAGWHYGDWAGIVYPEPRQRGFDPIEYLSRYFDLLEINSSFYRVPSLKTSEKWAKTASRIPNFEFTMKLYRGLTHEPGEMDEQAAVAFEQAAAPLSEAGKLGCLLMQFPWSFRATDEAKCRLERLLDRFARFETAVEIRHSSWLRTPWLQETLKSRSTAFCNIDQPTLRDCIGLTDLSTAHSAYLRLHGRNRENWFRENKSGAERYDYLYSEEELDAVAQAVRALKGKAKRVRVIANNHWQGQAAANALQLKAKVENRKVEAPKSLIRHFGGLGAQVAPEAPRDGEQLEMF